MNQVLFVLLFLFSYTFTCKSGGGGMCDYNKITTYVPTYLITYQPTDFLPSCLVASLLSLLACLLSY